MMHLTTESVGGLAARSRAIRADAARGLAHVSSGAAQLVLTSPPYNIGKIYERDHRLTFEEYLNWQAMIVDKAVAAVDDRGSICWQVGNYVRDGALIPLDVVMFDIFHRRGLKLRNRIIWRFNFGLNSDRRFSGRYETILWFTKSDNYRFNLDPVRIPQLYPGKRHSSKKGARAGQPSGNPKGKNPADFWEFSAQRDFVDNPVWDIPNVKSNHPEKTDHPCQFPVELAERCILALTDPGGLVLDPFVGTGSTIIAAEKQGRLGLGTDKDPDFVLMANARLAALADGNLPLRPLGRMVHRPNAGERVAQRPAEWLQAS